MEFPKAPTKKTFGKLRLIIKPPGAETVVETVPIPEPGTDDSSLKFKLPPGFMIDENLDSLLARQKNSALNDLDEIEARYKKCKPCRDKGYDPTLLELARASVNAVWSFLSGKISAPVRMTIGHQESGDITYSVFYNNKTISVIFSGERNKRDDLIGSYLNNELLKHEKFTPESFVHYTNWLLES